MTSKRSRAIKDLPEGCIAAILSHTTPVDAGRFSVVSKGDVLD
ncbi:putative F-box domain-containing protein [Medicago truncatula]|uniref:Putative F-box domain-containing protein n=1 Tax=Medicago truncatula TaxID=3880 RepID=A0A396JCR1_MEDTR|nr:putative F-box domain-containing protein [Medicago truncatula]